MAVTFDSKKTGIVDPAAVVITGGVIGASITNISATAVLFGDSITANNNASPIKTQDIGYFTWGNALSGMRFNVLNNAGIAGNTTTQMLARIATDVLAYKPKICTVMGGTNDTDTDPVVVVPNLRSIYQTLTAAGIYVVALAVLPRPTGSTAQKQNILLVNRWIADYWASKSGGEFVDAFAAVVDPTSTTQAATSNALSDNVHPSNLGAYWIGKKISPVLQRFSSNSALVSSAYDDAYVNTASLVKSKNPMMLGSGGVAYAPFTGAAATGFSVSASGSPSGTASVVARADGMGNDQVVTITSTANNDKCIINPLILFGAGGLAVGDQFYVEFEVSIVSPVALKSVEAYMLAQGDNSGNSAAFTPVGASGNLPEAATFTMRTPVATIPAGSTAPALTIAFTFSGAGSATIKIGRLAVRKYTYAG